MVFYFTFLTSIFLNHNHSSKHSQYIILVCLCAGKKSWFSDLLAIGYVVLCRKRLHSPEPTSGLAASQVRDNPLDWVKIWHNDVCTKINYLPLNSENSPPLYSSLVLDVSSSILERSLSAPSTQGTGDLLSSFSKRRRPRLVSSDLLRILRRNTRIGDVTLELCFNRFRIINALKTLRGETPLKIN